MDNIRNNIEYSLWNGSPNAYVSYKVFFGGLNNIYRNFFLEDIELSITESFTNKEKNIIKKPSITVFCNPKTYPIVTKTIQVKWKQE